MEHGSSILPSRYEIGVGVSSLDGTALGAAVEWDGEPRMPSDGFRTSATIELVTTQEEFLRKVGVDVSAGVTYGKSSASVRSEFAQQFRMTTLSSWVVIRVVVSAGPKALGVANGVRLTNAARDTLAAGGFPAFFRSYGDRYITAMKYGGEFIAVLQINSTSRETKESLKRSWQATAGVKGLTVKTSGSIENVLEQASYTDRTEFKCQVIGPNPALPEPTVASTVEFARNFPAMVTHDNVVALSVDLQDYRLLAGEAVDWPLLASAREVLETISDYLDTLHGQRLLCEEVISQPNVYRRSVRSQFESIASEIDTEIDTLSTTAKTIITSLHRSADPEVPTPPAVPKWVAQELPRAETANTFMSGDVIALQGDNRLYLSRIARDGTHPIEAAKSSIDEFSKFKVTVLPNGKITLQADTSGYLSRISRGGPNPIEAVKVIDDVHSQFTVELLSGDQIALKADTGRYLSRVNRGATNPVEAAKDLVDVPSRFRRIFLSLGDA